MAYDPYHHVIDSLAHAVLNGYTNEVTLEQKEDPLNHGHEDFDDPIKFRFGAWRPADGRPGYYIGAISMDVLEHNSEHPEQPKRIEVGFIALKVDPEPCIEFYLQSQTNIASDPDMKCVLRINQKGLELDPKHAGGITAKGFGAGPSGGQVTRFYTDGGKFMINWQDDTNEPTGIVYNQATGTAVGKVRIDPL